jgi:hypothetical protein
MTHFIVVMRVEFSKPGMDEPTLTAWTRVSTGAVASVLVLGGPGPLSLHI